MIRSLVYKILPLLRFRPGKTRYVIRYVGRDPVNWTLEDAEKWEVVMSNDLWVKIRLICDAQVFNHTMIGKSSDYINGALDILNTLDGLVVDKPVAELQELEEAGEKKTLLTE